MGDALYVMKATCERTITPVEILLVRMIFEGECQQQALVEERINVVLIAIARNYAVLDLNIITFSRPSLKPSMIKSHPLPSFAPCSEVNLWPSATHSVRSDPLYVVAGRR